MPTEVDAARLRSGRNRDPHGYRRDRRNRLAEQHPPSPRTSARHDTGLIAGGIQYTEASRPSCGAVNSRSECRHFSASSTKLPGTRASRPRSSRPARPGGSTARNCDAAFSGTPKI
jgi:hypothetical protein